MSDEDNGCTNSNIMLILVYTLTSLRRQNNIINTVTARGKIKNFKLSSLSAGT